MNDEYFGAVSEFSLFSNENSLPSRLPFPFKNSLSIFDVDGWLKIKTQTRVLVLFVFSKNVPIGQY